MRKPLLLLVILLSFISTGVSKAASEAPAVIKVKPGDTLSQLCAKYLENPADWPLVAKLNRLNNPHQIFPNDYLMIPVDLLKGVPIQGKITHIQGTVELLPENSSEQWIPLNLDDSIEQGQKIRTSPESSVEITYPDDVTLFLRENSVVRVVNTREKSAANKAYDFFLDIGRSSSKIRKATGKKQRYQIRTPTAVTGARGTQYRVSVDEKKDTRLEVLDGSVNIGTQSQSLQVEAGHGTRVSTQIKKSSVVKLLSSPAPADELQPLYRSMPLRFSFLPVEGSGKIRAALARDPELKNLVKEKVLDPGAPFELIGVDDGRYYLACRAIDPEGIEGLSSAPVPIDVRINPLPPFVQSPLNEADIKGDRCDIRWLRVSDAVSYHVQIAEDPDFKTIVQEVADHKDPNFETRSLPYRTYFYRISSIAADNYQGVWSDTNRVNLIPPPPAPEAQEPDIDDEMISIRWQNVGPNITYRFQVSTDPDFMETLIDQQTDLPQITFPRFSNPGIYYSRIQAIDSDGYAGSFSAPQSFEVEYELTWLSGGVILTYIAAMLLLL